MRRLTVAVVAIGFLLFAIVSSFGGFWPFLHGVTLRVGVNVMEAESRPSDRLRVGVASCNADPEVVLLRETDVDVQIRVVANFWPFSGGGDDCQDGVEVQLQEPLGDRIVVDKHRGDPVNVRRGRSVMEAELRSPDRIRLIVNTCNRGPRLVLRRETDVELQVMVVDSDAPLDSGDVCREIVEFNLREPLGDRVVVDMHTGQLVNVTTID